MKTPLKKIVLIIVLGLLFLCNSKGTCPTNRIGIYPNCCSGSIIEASSINDYYYVNIGIDGGSGYYWKLYENGILVDENLTTPTNGSSIPFRKTSPGFFSYRFLILATDGTGLCYTATAALRIYAPMSSGQYNSVGTKSLFAQDPNKSHLFYINTNRIICSLWTTDYSTWYDAIFCSSATSLTTNSGLVSNPNNNDVIYIGTNRKIYHIYNSGGNNVTSQLCAGQYNNARNESKLLFDQYYSHLFYVSTNNQICALWTTDGSTWGDAVMNATNFVPALTGNAIALSYDSQGTDIIYYVANNRKIYKLAYDYSSGNFVCSIVCSGQYNLASSNFDIIRGPGGIYYVNTNRQLCALYTSDGINWGDAVLSGSTKVKDNTSLAYNSSADAVYFISDDNKIYKYLYPNPVAKAVSLQLNVDASLYFSNNQLYFSYSNNKHIYKYDLSTLKSAKDESEFVSINPNIFKEQNDLRNINIFPNPSNGIINIENINNPVSIVIYDNLGRMIYRNDNFNSNQINLTGNSAGLYYLRVTKNDQILNKKLIIQ